MSEQCPACGSAVRFVWRDDGWRCPACSASIRYVAGRPRRASTYVRTRRVFHKRDCPALKRARGVFDWVWMDTDAHVTPVGYGRAVRGNPSHVQACLRCFPEVKG